MLSLSCVYPVGHPVGHLVEWLLLRYLVTTEVSMLCIILPLSTMQYTTSSAVHPYYSFLLVWISILLLLCCYVLSLAMSTP